MLNYISRNLSLRNHVLLFWLMFTYSKINVYDILSLPWNSGTTWKYCSETTADKQELSQYCSYILYKKGAEKHRFLWKPCINNHCMRWLDWIWDYMTSHPLQVGMPTIYQQKYLDLYLGHITAPIVLLFYLLSCEMVHWEFLTVASPVSFLNQYSFFLSEIHCQFFVPNVWMSKSTLNVLSNKTNQQKMHLLKYLPIWKTKFQHYSLQVSFVCYCFYLQVLQENSATIIREVTEKAAHHLRYLSLVHLEKSLLSFQDQTNRGRGKKSSFHCLLAVLLGPQSCLTQHLWYYLPVHI